MLFYKQMRQYSIVHALTRSFHSKDLYRDVAENWNRVIFLYLLLLLSLASIPTISKIHVQMRQFAKVDAPAFIQQIPDITIEDGVVSIQEEMPYTIYNPETDEPFAIIDTTGTITSIKDLPVSILLLEDKLIGKKNERETRTYDLSEIKSFQLTEQKLTKWANVLEKWTAIVLFPIILITAYIGRLIQSLIYAAIGMIFVNITHAGLTYSALIRLALVAITPAVILDMARRGFGITIPLWGLMCFVISIAYIYFAVKACADIGTAQPIEVEELPPEE